VKKRLMVGLLSAGLVAAMLPGVGLAAKPAPMPADRIWVIEWWSDGSGSEGLCLSHVDVTYDLAKGSPRLLGARNVFHDGTEGEQNVSKALRGGQMTIDLVPFDVINYPDGHPMAARVALYDGKGTRITYQTTTEFYMHQECLPDGELWGAFEGSM
jgi:hypothetical protein